MILLIAMPVLWLALESPRGRVMKLPALVLVAYLLGVIFVFGRPSMGTPGWKSILLSLSMGYAFLLGAPTVLASIAVLVYVVLSN